MVGMASLFDDIVCRIEATEGPMALWAVSIRRDSRPVDARPEHGNIRRNKTIPHPQEALSSEPSGYRRTIP
jgi:hypothetical protein